LKDVINGSAIRYFEYDPDKNLTVESLTIGTTTWGIGHSYSENDARDSTTYPSGMVVTYSANGFGRPTRATPFLNSVDYHPTGEVETIAYANGVTTSVTLNNRLWPERLTSSKNGTTSPVADFQYTTYDGVGNVTRFDDFVDATNSIPTLSYDEIDRLKVASSNRENPRTFDYDGVGNITSQTLGGGSLTYTYDPLTNRLNSISGIRTYLFQYDNYGNVRDNGSQTFTYDDAGNLRVVGTVASYDYDGQNWRVHARRSGEDLYFFYAADGRLMGEYNCIGEWVKEYAYLDKRLIATLYNVAEVSAP